MCSLYLIGNKVIISSEERIKILEMKSIKKTMIKGSFIPGFGLIGRYFQPLYYFYPYYQFESSNQNQ